MMSRADGLNLVLLGKSGVGKSSCGNTILGKQVFKTRPPSSSETVTLKPQIASGAVGDTNVVVIDTPDLFGSQISQEELQKQMASIVAKTSPGPCIFMIVIHHTDVCNLEETFVIIQATFGKKAADSSMAIITHGDHRETTIESFPDGVKQKMHIFDNTKHQDSKQVKQLFSKIDRLLQNNIGFSLKQTLKTAPAVKPKPLRRFKPAMAELGSIEIPFRFSKKLNTWIERERRQSADHVRLVLIGKTGVGKSATGNTILGNKEFKSSALMMSITKECEKRKVIIGSKMVHVIDTPGLFDTAVSNDTIREEIGKCIAMASPGPHVFLLLISVGRFTQEERETVKMIQEIFGEYAKAYTMVGFTKGEELKDEGIQIEEYIKRSPPALQELIADCGGRYHVFCNKDKDTHKQQAVSLLGKIDKMIQKNGGSFYTTAMFEETEEKITAREMRMLQQRLEELEQAHTDKEKDVSFLVSEISKIKLRLEKRFKNLRDGPHKETDEDMKKLEELQVKLERSHEMKLSEMDTIIFDELHSAREGIRKKAEKAEAKALAKSLNPNKSCTIS